MITLIDGEQRHFSDFGWLKTYWLFSFADYFDPANIQFGPLRVFNDDVVIPGMGFPTHPHAEMEIITIVLDGEITHQDSMGNISQIKAGDVQRMSAGTGLTHSEFNRSMRPVHFYQIWILPDQRGLSPSYAQRSFTKSERHNQLLPIASGQPQYPDTVRFHTDATIFRADLEAGRAIRYETSEERRIFIYLTSGTLQVNGQKLLAKDQARVDLEKEVMVLAQDNADFILIDLPTCKGWGYDAKTLRGQRAPKE